jgi:arylsulfatase A-like enzyme
MQMSATECTDLSRESAATQREYGLEDPVTAHFGRNCLLARRLVERGVRFVQLYSGGNEGPRAWDAHDDLKKNHDLHCAETDRPIAALLADLKTRGLLETTLVVWGGEFGRTPVAENGKGRDHHPKGFTMWLAGGGVRGGLVYGATDEFGYNAVEKRVSVPDLHATILHQLGLHHEQLTYRHSGRDYRLTDVSGKVLRDILA